MIRLQSVFKTYRQGKTRITALHDVSLDIPRSSFITIRGKSGSGKSTLLKVLALIEPADTGHYILEGKDLSRLKDGKAARLRNRHLALITQHPTLIETASTEFNVLLPYYIRRERICPDVRRELKQCLESLGMVRYAKTRVSQLSGGERQRVCIARAIVSKAEYIFADEPTGALDSETGKDLMTLLGHLKELGRAVVMVTHDRDFARCGEKRYVMLDGRLSLDTE